MWSPYIIMAKWWMDIKLLIMAYDIDFSIIHTYKYTHRPYTIPFLLHQAQQFENRKIHEIYKKNFIQIMNNIHIWNKNLSEHGLTKKREKPNMVMMRENEYTNEKNFTLHIIQLLLHITQTNTHTNTHTHTHQYSLWTPARRLKNETFHSGEFYF